MSVTQEKTPWLLLAFRLPTRCASQRVEIWRRLRRLGALPLGSAGYLLPHTAATREQFEWLARTIRRHRGEASVVGVESVDARPAQELAQRLTAVRTREYEALIKELKRRQGRRRRPLSPLELGRLRRRFQQVVERDYFESPLRSRVESLLEKAAAEPAAASPAGQLAVEDYRGRDWVTRPRPGIDRAASAWLIRRFIDPEARFHFARDPADLPGAVPFDMFQPGGFGHRGEDCTFETLLNDFGLHEPRLALVAQIIHDADLGDERFGRVEGVGLDRALVGWAQQGVSDEELLRRGEELIEGLYRALP